jgi:hypothetical protein
MSGDMRHIVKYLRLAFMVLGGIRVFDLLRWLSAPKKANQRPLSKASLSA